MSVKQEYSESSPNRRHTTKLNVHAYPTTGPLTSGIGRITRTLLEARVFDRVLVIGTWEPGLSEREIAGDGLEVWRLKTVIAPNSPRSKAAKLLHRIEWGTRLLWALRGANLACINAHTLIVLVFFVPLKLWRRCKLVYDTHELETEKVSLNRVTRWIAKGAERLLIRHVDVVSVVGPRIGDWYRHQYPGTPVYCVRNVPAGAEECEPFVHNLHQRFSINATDLVFLYIGVVASGRGISQLVEAFKQLPNDYHLVFLGSGELEGWVRAQTCRNIHFHPQVPSTSVCWLARDADVGLVTIENCCLSYYYALPNKLFQCLAAGIPVIVSAFPEMRTIVEQYQCGWTVGSTVEQLVHLITSLDRNEIMQKKPGALAAGRQFAWENERHVLLEMYAAIGIDGILEDVAAYT